MSDSDENLWDEQDFGVFISRFLAVVLLLFGVPGEAAPLEDVIQGLFTGSGSFFLGVIPNFFTTLVPISFAWFFWVHAENVSIYLLPEYVDEGESKKKKVLQIPNSSDIKSITISTVGLIACLFAVVHIVSAVVSQPWSEYNPFHPSSPGSRSVGYGSVIAWILIALIGIYLIFYGRDVADWMQPEENGGSPEDNEKEDEDSS